MLHELFAVMLGHFGGLFQLNLESMDSPSSSTTSTKEEIQIKETQIKETQIEGAQVKEAQVNEIEAKEIKLNETPNSLDEWTSEELNLFQDGVQVVLPCDFPSLSHPSEREALESLALLGWTYFKLTRWNLTQTVLTSSYHSALFASIQLELNLYRKQINTLERQLMTSNSNSNSNPNSNSNSNSKFTVNTFTTQSTITISSLMAQFSIVREKKLIPENLNPFLHINQ